MNEPTTLVEAICYFADPDVCLAFMLSLRWPDGTEHRRAVFSRHDAQVPGTEHLSLEDPRIRSITTGLPFFAPGQPLSSVHVPGVSDKVAGVWALWLVALQTGEGRAQLVLPLFVSAGGRVPDRTNTGTFAANPMAVRRALVPAQRPPMITTHAAATPGTPPSSMPRPPCSSSRQWAPAWIDMRPATSLMGASRGSPPWLSVTVS